MRGKEFLNCLVISRFCGINCLYCLDQTGVVFVISRSCQFFNKVLLVVELFKGDFLRPLFGPALILQQFVNFSSVAIVIFSTPIFLV